MGDFKTRGIDIGLRTRTTPDLFPQKNKPGATITGSMDVEIDRSKPNPLRRFLVWFAGFLLTGRVANEYTLSKLKRVSAARVAFSLLQVALVAAAVYYFGFVVPTSIALGLLAIALYWVGMRAVMMGIIGGVAKVFERLQYYRRKQYAS